MTGILLAMIVSLLKSWSELTGKLITSEKRLHKIDEYSLAFWIRIFSLVVLFPVVFFIPPVALDTKHFVILFLSWVFNSVATVTSLKALKYGDLSLVSPLSAFTIPFLLLTAYLIAWEAPNMFGIVWVMIIFIGTYFLQISEVKNGAFWPIKAILQNTGARYMLLTAILWSITTPLDKLGILEYGVLTWMLYQSIAMCIFIGIYFWIFHRKKLSSISNPLAIKKILALWGIWGLSLLLQMFALKFTLAVYVVSIKRASGIFSVILWALFFKEKNIKSKLLAAAIMFSWVCVITVFWNI